MEQPIRIVIADHHYDYRSSVINALSREGDLEVVGHAASALEALQIALDQHPDILLLDHRLPGDGMSIISALHTFRPAMKIALLATHVDSEQASMASLAGVNGYLSKGVGANQLAQTLRAMKQATPSSQPMIPTVV
jgi:two-component system, NarL family, nitrate/nitrite response regulator NarL